jgi:3-hydroxy-9,10-secoandrosta-1,3,5(10)-triene-9,17-dione monooxygenase reductase component
LSTTTNNAAGFREAMSHLATGVTVVTTTSEGAWVGMTASAVCSLSLEPIQVLVCISRGLRTHQLLERGGRFAVNVLGEGQERLAERFATPDIDRFADVALTEKHGVPLLSDAIAHFICDVTERFPGGDHSIFIGGVREFSHRSNSRPLLQFASGFGTLAGPESHLLRAWLDGSATP